MIALKVGKESYAMEATLFFPSRHRSNTIFFLGPFCLPHHLSISVVDQDFHLHHMLKLKYCLFS